MHDDGADIITSAAAEHLRERTSLAEASQELDVAREPYLGEFAVQQGSTVAIAAITGVERPRPTRRPGTRDTTCPQGR